MSTLLTKRATTGGFTLIEILLALLFLSLGIMGVIAFFFLGAHDSREAVRMTRATMIAKEVRQGLIHALRYPVYVDVGGTGEMYPVYRFELPTVRAAAMGESQPLDEASAWEIPDFQLQRTDFGQINGFYFVIDDNQARPPAGLRETIITNLEDAANPRDAVLDLPRQAAPTADGSPMNEVYTWDYRDGFKRSSFPQVSVFNEDDSQMYSFRVLIRRGPSASGQASGMFEPGDILCVTVYVFRQFNPVAAAGQHPLFPGYEWDGFDPRTGQARYSTPAGPVRGIQPIATYHFYIGSS